MSKGLRDALEVVGPFWPWVFAVGVGGTVGSTGIWQNFLLLVIIATVALMIILYGRIIAALVSDGISGRLEILKENWLNYLVAVLIMRAPEVALRILVAKLMPPMVVYVVSATAISAAFGILTLYALPIVFIKKSSLTAVIAGVVFLFRNLSASAWIAGIVAATAILAATGAVFFKTAPTPGSFGLIFVTNVAASLLTFVSFTAASRILLRSGGQLPDHLS